MKMAPNPSLLTRISRGIKVRSQNQLRHHLLRSIEVLPAPLKFAWRNIIFSRLGALFTGNSTYENWQSAYRYFVTNRSPQIELIELSKLKLPEQLPTKKIAIQAHIFYPNIALELVQLLEDFPAPFDLFISTADGQHEVALRSQFASLPQIQNIRILITPNQGRDLGPLLYGYGQDLLQYDYFAHVHTKKSSATNQIGNAWRRYLFAGLLDNSHGRVTKILGLLDRYGLIYPERFAAIDVDNCQWRDNLPAATAFCNCANIAAPTPGYIEFPVGSMFWAQTSALKPLLNQAFTPESFELESGQTDNTLAHALERSLSHIALSQGYPIGLIQSAHYLPYYPWLERHRLAAKAPTLNH